jgi:hypothetical protein
VSFFGAPVVAARAFERAEDRRAAPFRGEIFTWKAAMPFFGQSLPENPSMFPLAARQAACTRLRSLSFCFSSILPNAIASIVTSAKSVVVIRFEDDAKAEAFERYLKFGSGHAFAAKHFW